MLFRPRQEVKIIENQSCKSITGDPGTLRFSVGGIAFKPFYETCGRYSVYVKKGISYLSARVELAPQPPNVFRRKGRGYMCSTATKRHVCV
jgi:hypothetical protein